MPAKARLDAVAGLLRRHALFTALLVAAAGLRAVVLLAYRPALLFNGDSYGYLANARDLTPRVWRPLGYPILVRGMLALDRNLSFVVAAQHLLGLGVGVLVYALARRLGAGALWASVAAAPVLFDAFQLDIEQFVMAETLFELLEIGRASCRERV